MLTGKWKKKTDQQQKNHHPLLRERKLESSILPWNEEETVKKIFKIPLVFRVDSSSFSGSEIPILEHSSYTRFFLVGFINPHTAI
jgi:hypothetical protein